MGARTRGLANNVLTSGKLDATDAVSGVISASNIANASLTSATTFGSASGGVPAVASDPPSPAEGDIWYNTTTGQIKFQAFVQSWASGGNLANGRRELGGAGIQTAGLAFAGYVSPGVPTTSTEEYNGSAWTAGGNLATSRQRVAGAGTQTAGLCYGGGYPPTNFSATEEYDGSTWTAGGNMNTSRYQLFGVGIQTATVAFGGAAPYSSATEEYDGSAWTSGNPMNTAQRGGAGAGTQTAALGFAGYVSTGTQNTTEAYDGSTWTTLPATLATARGGLWGAGTNTLALAFGGGSYQTATEEWTSALATTIVG